MGKEIIKPVPSGKPREKTPSLKLRIANAGLVVPLAIGALPFFNGCSQESSQPPKFPITDSDRPLQKGKKEPPIPVRLPTAVPTEKPSPTPTPPPTPTKEIPSPTRAPTPAATATKEPSIPVPIPTEEPIEPGWKTIKSISLPFQISYPPSFTVLGNQLLGETIGYIRTSLTIYTDPVKEWVTLTDYKIYFVEKEASVFPQFDPIKEAPKSVAGQNAWVIESIPRAQTNAIMGKLKRKSYILIYKGDAWIIRYEADQSIFDEKAPILEKMVRSFKLLK